MKNYPDIYSFSFLIFGVTVLSAFSFAQFKYQSESSENPKISTNKAAEISQLSIQGLNGETYKVTDFKGKIVVLDFWATWCAPCISGFIGFEKVQQDYPDKIEIIAVAGFGDRNSNKIKKFKKKYDDRFDLHYAFDKELSNDLGISSIPFKIIYGPEGELIESKTGTKDSESEKEYFIHLIEAHF